MSPGRGGGALARNGNDYRFRYIRAIGGSIAKRGNAVAALVAATTLALIAPGCSSGGESQRPGEPEVAVVATTTHIADLARNAGGPRAEVVGLAAANADPHDHEPRPSDVEAVAGSDLVLKAGGDLDLWVDGIVESSGTEAPVVELIDHVETIKSEHAGDHDHEELDGPEEDIDPHWWQDPANAVLAVEEIRDRLVAIDPEGAEEHEASAGRYIARLERLDAAIDACLAAIPPGDRKLVTGHDSLRYFAERYGIEVVGAAIPALTTQAQSSAGETAELVELIREQRVRVVFPEAGLGDGLERALARETGAELGGVLWGDTLGPPGSGAETYVDAIAANARTLAAGLSGGEASCPRLGARQLIEAP